jgi:predicted kinase
MLVIMAGLPGTGKSTLARCLAGELSALILDKDTVRAGLFPPHEIEYSTRQDDFVVGIMLQVAAFYFEIDPNRIIILDGRPFTRRYQVESVTDFAGQIGQPVKLCVLTCPDEAVRERLEGAVASGSHLAANRNFELHQRIKAMQEPHGYPHLQVDTSRDLGTCIQECIEYIASQT